MTLTIHIDCQYKENYGTAERPYWKYKGGDTYVVEGFSHPLTDGLQAAAEAVVNGLREQLEYANPMSEQYILDWHFEEPGTLTEDERLQAEYDGQITYPSPRIVLAQAA